MFTIVRVVEYVKEGDKCCEERKSHSADPRYGRCGGQGLVPHGSDNINARKLFVCFVNFDLEQ